MKKNVEAGTGVFGGFTNCKRKSIPPPSKAALERAKQLIEKEIISTLIPL